MTIDEKFISRTYKTGAAVAAFGFFIAATRFGIHAGIGWLLGSLVSAGILYSFEWFVRRTFVAEEKTAKKQFGKFSLLKFPVILAVCAAVVYLGKDQPRLIVGFACGIILMQTVMVLKVLGMMLQDRFS